ncbi:MAG: homocysteine S-methyltransferase family protein [bacterium]
MTFLEMLESGTVLLCDGGMGTELQKRGMTVGACPEELNVSDPDLVRQIHRDYFAAGSDIVETNSFGGTHARLAMHDFQDRVREFSTRAAELARAVCPPEKFVAGSIGPAGVLLEPFGALSQKEAQQIFTEQAHALKDGGVDVLFVETMMACEEAEAAVRAAKETGLPVAATMTFEPSKFGPRTKWGVDISTAVARLAAAGADIIGANCGCGFDEMIDVIQAMRPMTDLPILAQANAGIPEMIDNRAVYRETPDALRDRVEKLLGLGVNIIGGCCGTAPEHIRMMRQAVDRVNMKPGWHD